MARPSEAYRRKVEGMDTAPQDGPTEDVVAGWVTAFRDAHGLDESAEIVVVQRGNQAFLYEAGTFVHLDGGTLDLDAIRWPWRLRVRLRHAWGTLRYGWRWWEW